MRAAGVGKTYKMLEDVREMRAAGVDVVIGYFEPHGRKETIAKAEGLEFVPRKMIAYRGSARLVLRTIRRRGQNTRAVAVIGAGRLGQKLVHILRSQPWTGYTVSYFVCNERAGRELLGVPVYGPTENIEEILDAHPVDAVLIALPQERTAQLTDVLNKLSNSMVDVNVIPDLLSYQFLRHEVQQIGSLPIVNLTHSPQTGWNATFKRVLDVAVSLAILLLISPLLLLIALLVKCTSRGPVFYRQQRASLGGREFDIIKFRSMVVNAEAATGAVWATKNDPRVTPIGRILRKTSLDELPQLLNVLRGDMSLVGPRPERPELIERFSRQIPRYAMRHHVKAGITGWAQVSGYRGMTSLRKRIQYDLDYISRWSVGFDVYILVLTIFRGFIHKQD